MEIFTRKYFIVAFILPFIGINVIDHNVMISNISKIIVSIIGYFMLFEDLNYKKNILNIKLILLIMLYSFTIIFSAVINHNITTGMIYTNFVYIGFFIYINYCIKDFKNFINALNIVFTFLIIYNLILALDQSSYMYIGYQGSEKVFVGTFKSRNGISMVMIPAIAFILIRSEYIYKKVRKKDIMLCFMLAVIILLSKSSTALLVGTLLVVYVLIFKKINMKISIDKLMIIYAIAYVQIVIFRIQETVFKDFIVNVLHKNVTLTGRTLIWDFVMKIIPNSFIFGYGRDDTIGQHLIIREGVTEAHNGFLEILLCTGIIGVIIFILILITSFIPLSRDKSKIAYTLSMAIFLYFCIGLTESAFTYTKIGFWILIIIAANIKNIMKQKNAL